MPVQKQNLLNYIKAVLTLRDDITMATAYIGIGSNLGNREENCFRAIEFLIERGVKVTNRSSLYKTAPWGIKDQPEFINMAIEVETEVSPGELLRILKEIEVRLGRNKGKRWGPRVIDLDILFYDTLILKTPDLEIPHPGVSDRTFILKPLSEIAPDKIHPVLKTTVKDLFFKSRDLDKPKSSG